MADEIKVRVSPDADDFYRGLAAKILPAAERARKQAAEIINRELARAGHVTIDLDTTRAQSKLALLNAKVRESGRVAGAG
jgi:hypothetical protein